MTVVDDGTTSDDDRLGAIGDIGFVIDGEGIDDDLVVVAGDNLFAETLGDFGRAAREKGTPLLAIHDVGDLELIRGRYNSIEVDAHGRITFFEEKPDEPRSTLSGIGLYFYPRDSLPLIREYLAAGNNPDQPGRLVQWLYPRVDVYTWPVPGDWYDIGSRRAGWRKRTGSSRRRADTETTGSGRTLGRRARLAVPAPLCRLPRTRPRAVRSLPEGPAPDTAAAV